MAVPYSDDYHDEEDGLVISLSGAARERMEKAAKVLEVDEIWPILPMMVA